MGEARTEVARGIHRVARGAAEAEAEADDEDADDVRAVAGHERAVDLGEDRPDHEEQEEGCDELAEEVLPSAANGGRRAEEAELRRLVLRLFKMGQIGEPDDGGACDTAEDLDDGSREELLEVVDAGKHFADGDGRIEVSLRRTERDGGEYAEGHGKAPAKDDADPAASLALGAFERACGADTAAEDDKDERAEKFAEKIIVHRTSSYSSSSSQFAACLTAFLQPL